MREGDEITLSRDCKAIEIPAGFWTTLPKGTKVRVHQALGGTTTVIVQGGGSMVRIAAEDADALGAAPPPRAAASGGAGSVAELVEQELRTCYDPEIPVNIVDLGLVYDRRLIPMPDGRTDVIVEMTLTAPGCGMGDIIKEDIERKLAALPGVGDVSVEIVFDPPWDPSHMSEAARLELGMF
ncbi:MAG TPA: putative Fe-S cluster assembly protein SufT [Polyangia bacterium]|jgi:probable FeS assembly SUF system protein SufT